MRKVSVSREKTKLESRKQPRTQSPSFFFFILLLYSSIHCKFVMYIRETFDGMREEKGAEGDVLRSTTAVLVLYGRGKEENEKQARKKKGWRRK